MSNTKQTSIGWLISQLQKSKDWHRLLNEVSQSSTAETDIIGQALAMHDLETTITENTSDGFHTFKTLYEIRKAYNVALFNEWGSQQEVGIKQFESGHSVWVKKAKYNVHKSRKHHDGEYPFGKDTWFIVCAELPTGQISNHYPIEDWDLFKIPEVGKALFPFDGHTTDDVINRLIEL